MRSLPAHVNLRRVWPGPLGDGASAQIAAVEELGNDRSVLVEGLGWLGSAPNRFSGTVRRLGKVWPRLGGAVGSSGTRGPIGVDLVEGWEVTQKDWAGQVEGRVRPARFGPAGWHVRVVSARIGWVGRESGTGWTRLGGWTRTRKPGGRIWADASRVSWVSDPICLKCSGVSGASQRRGLGRLGDWGAGENHRLSASRVSPVSLSPESPTSPLTETATLF
jgi:hypothetical protein